ncbi:MAG: hypothetical protein ACI8Q6_000894 [Granulosicoccus sp.]
MCRDDKSGHHIVTSVCQHSFDVKKGGNEPFPSTCTYGGNAGFSAVHHKCASPAISGEASSTLGGKPTFAAFTPNLRYTKETKTIELNERSVTRNTADLSGQ